MKCIVCDIEKPGKGEQCKLCGMRSEKPIAHNGFIFCCGKCRWHFKDIISKASSGEREEMFRKDVMI